MTTVKQCETGIMNLNLGEHVTIDSLNNIAERIKYLDNINMVNAILEYGDLEDLLDTSIEWLYLQDVLSEEDLGYYYAHDSGAYDLSDMGDLIHYIDYESFGHDIIIEARGGLTKYGWIEVIL